LTYPLDAWDLVEDAGGHSSSQTLMGFHLAEKEDFYACISRWESCEAIEY
jgi:hypothetical protein